jgi:cytochrome c biogenesis protein CcdA
MSRPIPSRYSTVRPARTLLLGLFLAVLVVPCPLLPFALPSVWAEMQEDFRIMGQCDCAR